MIDLETAIELYHFEIRRIYIKKSRQAYAAISQATKYGKLIRLSTCEHCGANGRIHAHHYLGYEPENWLSVKWLCSSCHGAIHAHIRNNLKLEQGIVPKGTKVILKHTDGFSWLVLPLHSRDKHGNITYRTIFGY